MFAHLRVGNFLDDSQNVVSSSLDAARRNSVHSVKLSVINIAIFHIGDVQSGNFAIIAENSEIRFS